MSTISDAYDQIVTQMGTSFPNHKRIANPYKADENSERVLEQGWGIIVGPAQTQSLISCQWEQRRQVDIILTRKTFALEEDAIKRADVQKTILEDHFTLVSAFENDVTLSNNVSGFSPTADSGVEFIFLEKDNYYVIRQSFEMIYFENLT